MANERLSRSQFRTKPKVDGLLPTHAKRDLERSSQVTPAHKAGFDESVKGHEQRSREVRLEVGKTLDQSRDKNATKRVSNATGPTALLLQEKTAVVRTSRVPFTDDPARDDVLVALRMLHKDTRSQPAGILVDLVQRAMNEGASTSVLQYALERLSPALRSDHARSLLQDPTFATALRNASTKDPDELIAALMNMPAQAAPQLAGSSGIRFRESDAEVQRVWLAAFRTRVSLPPAVQANLERFLASDAFGGLPADVQVMMFRVVRETDGDVAVIDGLVRAAESPSFRDMPVSSKMSFTAVVGATLSTIRTGPEPQRKVLRSNRSGGSRSWIFSRSWTRTNFLIDMS